VAGDRFEDLVVGAFERGQVGDGKADAAGLGLVRQGGGLDLEREREAERVGGRGKVGSRGDEPSERDGEAALGEEGFGRVLRDRAGDVETGARLPVARSELGSTATERAR